MAPQPSINGLYPTSFTRILCWLIGTVQPESRSVLTKPVYDFKTRLILFPTLPLTFLSTFLLFISKCFPVSGQSKTGSFHPSVCYVIGKKNLLVFCQPYLVICFSSFLFFGVYNIKITVDQYSQNTCSLKPLLSSFIPKRAFAELLSLSQFLETLFQHWCVDQQTKCLRLHLLWGLSDYVAYMGWFSLMLDVA